MRRSLRSVISCHGVFVCQIFYEQMSQIPKLCRDKQQILTLEKEKKVWQKENEIISVDRGSQTPR